jgi:hypothetical protein
MYFQVLQNNQQSWATIWNLLDKNVYQNPKHFWVPCKTSNIEDLLLYFHQLDLFLPAKKLINIFFYALVSSFQQIPPA